MCFGRHGCVNAPVPRLKPAGCRAGGASGGGSSLCGGTNWGASNHLLKFIRNDDRNQIPETDVAQLELLSSQRDGFTLTGLF